MSFLARNHGIIEIFKKCQQIQPVLFYEHRFISDIGTDLCIVIFRDANNHCQHVADPHWRVQRDGDRRREDRVVWSVSALGSSQCLGNWRIKYFCHFHVALRVTRDLFSFAPDIHGVDMAANVVDLRVHIFASRPDERHQSETDETERECGGSSDQEIDSRNG